MVTAAPANLYGFIVSFHGLLIGYSKRTRSSRAFVRFDLATRRQTRKRARERETSRDRPTFVICNSTRGIARGVGGGEEGREG